MIATDVAWPKKTRELRTLHIDSTIWNDFTFRDDDIIIATYGKSGTTWMQQIISQMLFAGDTDQDTQAMSPWVDYVIPPKEHPPTLGRSCLLYFRADQISPP
jgi:aryl sulfotransferase